MTGVFSTVTPEKCIHYARFMQKLGRHEADAIFWTLFTFMILLLITASTMYTKAYRTLSDPERGPGDTTQHTQIRRKSLLISLICFILSLTAVIMEAFAAFNIQFCDGEDLMMLYWGSWTLIQVGSVIAILGIGLNQWYCLKEKEHPPWTVALGTPVLVIAACGHAWQSCVRAAWKKWRRKGGDATSTRSGDCRSRTASTTRPPTIPPHPDAILVGYSLDHEPLFAYSTGDPVPGAPLIVRRTSSETVSPDGPGDVTRSEASPGHGVQFVEKLRQAAST